MYFKTLLGQKTTKITHAYIADSTCRMVANFWNAYTFYHNFKSRVLNVVKAVEKLSTIKD